MVATACRDRVSPTVGSSDSHCRQNVRSFGADDKPMTPHPGSPSLSSRVVRPYPADERFEESDDQSERRFSCTNATSPVWGRRHSGAVRPRRLVQGLRRGRSAQPLGKALDEPINQPHAGARHRLRVGPRRGREPPILRGAGQQVVAIDRDPARLAGLDEPDVVGDVTDDSVLLAAGVERASALIAALDADADNIYVTLSARALRPDIVIIARAGDESSTAKLMGACADRQSAADGRSAAGRVRAAAARRRDPRRRHA